jgi:hypothetical protein
LRLCAATAALQDRWNRPVWLDISARYWTGAGAFMALRPQTIDGLQIKVLIALDMLMNESARAG